jgi:hypothetical protein
MEIRLTVVDDDGAIIGKAKIDIAVEETDEQGNKNTKITEAEANTEGQYKLEGLIPGKATITVRTPIERPYLTGTDGKPKKYAVDQDNDNEVRALEQIDGSEEIENEAEAQGGNQNQIVYKFDPGKNNVVKLPVRYLEKNIRKNRGLTFPGSNTTISEVTFVEKILGRSYRGKSIDIERIQIFVPLAQGVPVSTPQTHQYGGVPSVKQIQELLQHPNFQVAIVDSLSINNVLQENRFNQILNNPSSLQKILEASPGMSLPNGIIYIPPVSSTRYARTDNVSYNAVFIHEVFHQFQYNAGNASNRQNVFNSLMQEMWDNLRGKTIQNTNRNIIEFILGIVPPNDDMKNKFLFDHGGRGSYDSYEYQNFIGLTFNPSSRDPALVTDLQRIKTLEGQAQFIEDFTLAYLRNGNLSPFKKALYDNQLSSQIFTSVQF